jgi:hypothetical protein
VDKVLRDLPLLLDDSDGFEDLHFLQVLTAGCAYHELYLNKKPCRTSRLPGKDYVEELLSSDTNSNRVREFLRMPRETFLDLCDWASKTGLLKDDRHISIQEQLAMFMQIVGCNKSNREIQERVQHSGQTVSRHFRNVLRALEQLADDMIRLPKANAIPPEISSSSKFFLYFKDAIDAADGTHILLKVPLEETKLYRNRKRDISQNVLAICMFNLTFCYVLPGWEGSAHDGDVLKWALEEGGLEVPDGKYYLVDTGYGGHTGFLRPYRGVRYHLREQALASERPRNKEELCNLRHAQLRNVIERIFGVMKKRFKILKGGGEYTPETSATLVYVLAGLHNFIRIHCGSSESE